MRHNYELHVEVQGGEIIVTLPHSIYSVTYYKSPTEHLAAKMLPVTYDPNAVLTSDEFLSRAWKLANDKARERGWIV
ncbi:MAG: hypothetical protein ACXWJ4_11575 [Methyloceanibacter sp.]